MENRVSTTMRSFQVPRAQAFILGGLPSLATNPWSVSTIMSSANWAMSGWKVLSCTFAVAAAHPATRPHLFATTASLP